MKESGVWINHATQNSTQFKTYDLFISGIFHLILLESNWPRVNKNHGSRVTVRGGYYTQGGKEMKYKMHEEVTLMRLGATHDLTLRCWRGWQGGSLLGAGQWLLGVWTDKQNSVGQWGGGHVSEDVKKQNENSVKEARRAVYWWRNWISPWSAEIKCVKSMLIFCTRSGILTLYDTHTT